MTAVNITSTSITISWAPSSSTGFPDETTGYEVIHSTAEHAENWTRVLVNASQTSFNIEGLEKFTRYCVKVTASNNKREGSFSLKCLFVSTDEDGKLCFVKFIVGLNRLSFSP